jgi:4,5-dihydroxyphthalate decarboxylase
MTDLDLSFATGDSLRFDAMIDGRAKPQGASLRYSRVHPSELFWRQLTFQDFDVSEMSLSSLFIAHAHGVRDWVALPVFPRREFFHTWIMVRDGSDVHSPSDLRGKRVGVPEYQQTAAVWSRGTLSDEFGVTAADIDWYMEREPHLSHGGATAFAPPADVRLHYIPADDSMTKMVQRGELDAVLLFIAERTLADRSHSAEATDLMHPLFADPIREMARYHQSTGVLPLNHCIVVRRSLVEMHPWLPLNLFHAFEASRRLAFAEASRYLRLAAQLGRAEVLTEDAEQDPFVYGLAANELAINTLIRYQREQGLLSADVDLSELFATSCLSL